MCCYLTSRDANFCLLPKLLLSQLAMSQPTHGLLLGYMQSLAQALPATLSGQVVPPPWPLKGSWTIIFKQQVTGLPIHSGSILGGTQYFSMFCSIAVPHNNKSTTHTTPPFPSLLSSYISLGFYSAASVFFTLYYCTVPMRALASRLSHVVPAPAV